MLTSQTGSTAFSRTRTSLRVGRLAVLAGAAELKKRGSHHIKFLLIGDYITWLLTGKARAEETLISGSQCWDTRKRDWAWPVLKKLGCHSRTQAAVLVKALEPEGEA